MSQTIKTARKYGSKLAVVALTAPFAVTSFAQTADPIGDAMDAVSLDGIAAKVIAAGLLIVGIALAFKGPDLAKRIVRKV